MTTALEGGEQSASRPGRSLPPGKTRYPLYRGLCGPQGRSGQVRKISPPTGVQSPDRPARSQSLYRLRYPTHETWWATDIYKKDNGIISFREMWCEDFDWIEIAWGIIECPVFKEWKITSLIQAGNLSTLRNFRCQEHPVPLN